MQSIERGCICTVRERNASLVDLHLVEREEADVAVGRTLLHELHEEARIRQIFGIVVKAAEYERARRERALR